MTYEFKYILPSHKFICPGCHKELRIDAKSAKLIGFLFSKLKQSSIDVICDSCNDQILKQYQDWSGLGA